MICHGKSSTSSNRSQPFALFPTFAVPREKICSRFTKASLSSRDGRRSSTYHCVARVIDAPPVTSARALCTSPFPRIALCLFLRCLSARGTLRPSLEIPAGNRILKADNLTGRKRSVPSRDQNVIASEIQSWRSLFLFREGDPRQSPIRTEEGEQKKGKIASWDRYRVDLDSERTRRLGVPPFEWRR